MVTIYELLEVEEDASKEEIEKAYSRLVYEFRQDPSFDEATNKENEMIINRLKLAYEILTNDEKRQRYDKDLAQKRAESLIAGVTVNENPEVNQEQSENQAYVENNTNNQTQHIQNENLNNVNKENFTQNPTQQVNRNIENNANEDILSQKEKNDIRKAAKQEFNQRLKKAKRAEAEYNEAYNKAYNDYLRKMGYQVKEPWTLKRIIRLLISIVVIILVCIIMWCIPPIRNFFANLYEENFIIKAIVDIVKSVFNGIMSIFK